MRPSAIAPRTTAAKPALVEHIERLLVRFVFRFQVEFTIRTLVAMAGMPLFAHAGREELTPPPLSAPFELVTFCGTKTTKISLIQGAQAHAQAPHQEAALFFFFSFFLFFCVCLFCMFCSAKHAKTRGNPHLAGRSMVGRRCSTAKADLGGLLLTTPTKNSHPLFIFHSRRSQLQYAPTTSRAANQLSSAIFCDFFLNPPAYRAL